jgi:endonuclease/exonuclease/phosphatase family metal-dependent hydrolase
MIPALIQTTELINTNVKSNKNIENNSISILTLNSWGLPVWFKASTSKKRYFELISGLNNSDADIICLQETFNANLRNVLRKAIRKNLKTLNDFNCSRKINGLISMDCNGGLITYSKYPVLTEKFFPFPIEDGYSFIEKTGRKGFLFSTIKIKDDTINVLNTHLYSGYGKISQKWRIKQIMFIENTLRKIKDFNKFPTIFAGDFNMQHPDIVKEENKKSLLWEYFTLVKTLSLNEPDKHITEDELTFDSRSNSYNTSFEPAQKLDYIFFKDINSSFEILQNRVLFKNDNSVSDHNGYLVSFRFNKTKSSNSNQYFAQSYNNGKAHSN